MSTIELACGCGTVRGQLTLKKDSAASRIACGCSWCQRYAHHLGKADEVLGPYGCTQVLQVPPGALRFTAGVDQVKSLRQTSRGATRWYAGCCNTPLANTIGPQHPFLGVLTVVVQGLDAKDLGPSPLGPLRATVNATVAPADRTRLRARAWHLIALIARLMPAYLLGRIRGEARELAFYEAGRPIAEPVRVTPPPLPEKDAA